MPVVVPCAIALARARENDGSVAEVDIPDAWFDDLSKLEISFPVDANPISWEKCMTGRLLVPDQNRLDRVHWPQVMPFIAAFGDYVHIAASVIAFDNPVFHQHRLTVGKADGFRATTDGLREQTT